MKENSNLVLISKTMLSLLQTQIGRWPGSSNADFSHEITLSLRPQRGINSLDVILLQPNRKLGHYYFILEKFSDSDYKAHQSTWKYRYSINWMVDGEKIWHFSNFQKGRRNNILQHYCRSAHVTFLILRSSLQIISGLGKFPTWFRRSGTQFPSKARLAKHVKQVLFLDNHYIWLV